MSSLVLLDGGLSEAPDQRAWLRATDTIDIHDHGIRRRVARLISGAMTDREKALRLYRFVRDEIRFGWQTSFYDVKASEVLRAGIGYCNSKGTLFVAMLRAADIPARMRFVSLRSDILHGILETGSDYVDHGYVEVWIGGRWVGVDSYVVDRPLYAAAIERLERENKKLGYGVHRNGIDRWDGWNDSFVQFVDDGTVPWLSIKDHGVFVDVAEFYENVPNTQDALTPLRRLALKLFTPIANRRVERIRSERA